MAFIPIINVVKAELIYRQDGQTVENVLHYRALVTPGVEGMAGLASLLIANWNAVVKPLVHSSAALTLVRVTSLQSAMAPVVEISEGLPIAGTLAGTALPNNVTVAVKLVTLARGRSYRGRIYHVGLSSNAITGNVLTSGYRTSLRAAWDSFLDMGEEEAWRLVVASRYADNAPREEGISTLVDSVTVNPTVDSQRRRLPERGL